MYVSVSSKKNLSTAYYKEVPTVSHWRCGACQGVMLAALCGRAGDRTADEDPVLTYTDRLRPLWRRTIAG